jgi:hypothetical protein
MSQIVPISTLIFYLPVLKSFSPIKNIESNIINLIWYTAIRAILPNNCSLYLALIFGDGAGAV